MRRIIIGAALACYAAALIITASAVSLPVPAPTATVSPAAPAVAIVPPLSPSRPEPPVAEVAKVAPPLPVDSPAAAIPSEEDTLLQLAEKSHQAGDLKKAEATYWLLLQRKQYRNIAAQRLGKLYYDAEDYRRAGEMYRESAKALREGETSTP